VCVCVQYVCSVVRACVWCSMCLVCAWCSGSVLCVCLLMLCNAILHGIMTPSDSVGFQYFVLHI